MLGDITKPYLHEANRLYLSKPTPWIKRSYKNKKVQGGAPLP